MYEQDYEPLGNLSLKKSNEMICAKYQSSLLENQVMAIALTRIEFNNRKVRGPLQAKLYPRELKELIGEPTHIYRTLKTLSKTMTGHTMLLEDGKGNFKAFAIVTNADYIDGVFTMTFNDILGEHLLGLEKNYTTLELSVLTGLTKNSSYRLFEILKKEMWKAKIGSNNGMVTVEYNIAELKFMIGLANSDCQKFKNEIARMGNHINWEMLYEHLDKKDKMYEEWRDFQRSVIKVAQEELEKTSNIRFEYTPIREGRKIKRIRFNVFHNKPINQKEVKRREEIIIKNNKVVEEQSHQLDIFTYEHEKLITELEGHNKLTRDDINLFLEKANYDDEKVRRAIEKADKQDNIKNYVGWIITCIKDGYDEVEVVKGSAELADQVNNIMENMQNNGKEIAEKFWNKIKNKGEYEEFEECLKKAGMSTMALEIACSSFDECVKVYCNWKTKKQIIIESN